MKLDHKLIPCTRITQDDKRLKHSHNTIKLLEENTGRKISDIPHSNIFTDISPRARDIKERINKWDYIKLKSFCTAKENISKMKREPTIWEYVFANDNLDRGLIFKIYKELTDSTLRRQTIQLKNGQRTRTDISPKRTYRWPTDRHTRKCPMSLIIREMQIKSTISPHICQNAYHQ